MDRHHLYKAGSVVQTGAYATQSRQRVRRLQTDHGASIPPHSPPNPPENVNTATRSASNAILGKRERLLELSDGAEGPTRKAKKHRLAISSEGTQGVQSIQISPAQPVPDLSSSLHSGPTSGDGATAETYGGPILIGTLVCDAEVPKFGPFPLELKDGEVSRTFRVGSDHDCDVRIEDEAVNAHHCNILVERNLDTATTGLNLGLKVSVVKPSHIAGIDMQTEVIGNGRVWRLVKKPVQLDWGYVVRLGSKTCMKLEAPKLTSVYNLDKRLFPAFGQAANCMVMAAHRYIDCKPVVMKLITQSREFMMQRERRLLTTLRHPNVVSVAEIRPGLAKHSIAIVMEPGLASIGIMAERLRTKDNLSENGLIKPFAGLWTMDIADALKYIHSLGPRTHGVAHRDMKPDNVVVFETSVGWTAKLIDFGLARGNDEPVEAGWLVGTPKWMSPMSFTKAEDDRPADCYGLGRVLADILGFDYPQEVRASGQICDCKVNCAGVCCKKSQFWFKVEAELDADCQSFLKALLVSHPRGCLTADQMLRHPYGQRASKYPRRWLTDLASTRDYEEN